MAAEPGVSTTRRSKEGCKGRMKSASDDGRSSFKGDQLPEWMRRPSVVFELSELVDSVRHKILNRSQSFIQSREGGEERKCGS